MIVPNSCIYYLINNREVDIKRLISSLECLDRNFLKNYPYPVVLGYEDLSQEDMDMISSKIKVKHFFHKLSFELPNYSAQISEQIPVRFKGHWDESAFFSMGYRHMCRFFSGEMYKYEFFEKVKYLMRMDCDSYFTDEVKYDPFARMSKKKAVYGYQGVETDMDYVIEGLHEFCCKILPQNSKLPYNNMFQTHFEIVDFQWFKTGDYMNFYNKIDETGNIYIKRWGDAPIKYQGVMGLVLPEQLLKLDLPYRHGGDL